MKTLLAILIAALTFPVYACDWDDHDCRAREAEQAEMKRDIAQQRIDFEQMQREQERERREYETQQQHREYNSLRTEKGTSDVICHYLDKDC